MKTIGSLLFAESVQANNRVAKVDCSPSVDTDFSIYINGTDGNGISVYPLFVTIDNYQNSRAASYSIDGTAGGIAAYTKQTIAISPFARSFAITVNIALVTLYFSEQRLSIGEGQKFQVTATNFTLIRTNTGTIIIPTNWNNNSNKIHVIGAGSRGIAGPSAGSGGGGGGAGAYARRENVVLVPGTSIPVQIGLNNQAVDTTFNGAGFLLGKSAGADTTIGALASACVGDIKYSGGNGLAGSSGVSRGGGGGGAGGPNGPGVPSGGAIGGTGDSGVTGGLGGINTAGGNGVTWSRIQDTAVFGPGGGGAGGISAIGFAAGNYGAGGGGGGDTSAGGFGTDGLIVLEWTP